MILHLIHRKEQKMYVNIDSIIINNISMGQYITQADFEYNKLWSSDSGRNLAGTQTRYINWNIS